MQQFSHEEDRMSDAEAKDVLRLLAERQQNLEERRAQPKVVDVAMLSNCSEDEVRSALEAVRLRGDIDALALEKRRNRRSLAFCACILVLFLILVPFIPSKHEVAPAPEIARPVIANGFSGSSPAIAPEVELAR